MEVDCPSGCSESVEDEGVEWGGWCGRACLGGEGLEMWVLVVGGGEEDCGGLVGWKYGAAWKNGARGGDINVAVRQAIVMARRALREIGVRVER